MKNFLSKIKDKFKVKMPAGSTALSPHKHWRALLVSLFVIIFLLIIFSFYLLFVIKKGEIYHDDSLPTDTVNPLNEKLLDKVTKDFDAKAQREKEIMANPPVFADPSL